MKIRYIIFLFLIAMSMIFTSCNTGSRRTIGVIIIGSHTFTSIESIGSNRIILTFDRTVVPKERKLLIASARRLLRAFEFDWGKETRPVQVFYFRLKTIPCGLLVGNISGCHIGLNGPIHLTMGEFFTSTALYHELVHHNIPGGDANHTDARWKNFWQPRQLALYALIRADHRVILGR